MAVLADVISQIQTFVNVFVTIYSIVILLYIISSWIRLPYSPTLNRIQRFLYDVSEPFLRQFRRFLPSMGPLDLSPMIALIVLVLFAQVLNGILERFH